MHCLNLFVTVWFVHCVSLCSISCWDKRRRQEWTNGYPHTDAVCHTVSWTIYAWDTALFSASVSWWFYTIEPNDASTLHTTTGESDDQDKIQWKHGLEAIPSIKSYPLPKTRRSSSETNISYRPKQRVYQVISSHCHGSSFGSSTSSSCCLLLTTDIPPSACS